jgi:hypothetical protein
VLHSVFGPDQGNLFWLQITTRGVTVFLACTRAVLERSGRISVLRKE